MLRIQKRGMDVMVNGLRAMVIAVMLVAVSSSAWAAGKVDNIDNAQLAELLAKGIPVIDIRTPGEWKQTGVVEGSHLLMAFDERGKLSPDFVPGLAKIAGPEDAVVLICRTGNRTGAIANALVQQLGYSQVYNVTNGIKRWIAEGGAVTR